MKHYQIAGLFVDIDCQYDMLQRRLKKYEICNPPRVDISIPMPQKGLAHILKKNSALTLSEAEYIAISSIFSYHLLKYERFYIHASAIAYKGKAVLFSADSGVGKSTHTKLWQQTFGQNEVIIINDDKPVLHHHNNHFRVYGTPFSGNSDENENICIPLHAIVFIKRSDTNSIRSLSVHDALPLLMKQTTRYSQSYKLMNNLLDLIDQLLKITPIYELSCNMEPEAALVAKETLFPPLNERV